MAQSPHLGYLISAFRTGADDINERTHRFMVQVNSILCQFSQVDSWTRCKLFQCKLHQLLYGCELWNLENSQLQSLCVAWRKDMRLIMDLRYESSRDLLYSVSNCIPIYDEISRRSSNFIHSALTFGSKLCSLSWIIL